jgi:hypothetical protein
MLLSFLLLPAACSKGAEADLASISEARSLAAEWALVNDQAQQGRLTAAYTGTMRRELREQLQTDAGSLKQPHSRYGAEMRALLALPDEASPDRLRAHVRELKQIEDNLESA